MDQPAMDDGPRITDILQAWGRSRALNDAYSLDFPHQSPYAREMRNSGQWSSKTPPLDDELHAQVDAAVSELKNRGGQRHKVIFLAYVEGKSDSDIARRLKSSRSSVRSIRMAGESWLDARLI